MCTAGAQAPFANLANQAAQQNPAFRQTQQFTTLTDPQAYRAAVTAPVQTGQDGEQIAPPSEGGVVDRREVANKSRTLLEGPLDATKKTMLGK